MTAVKLTNHPLDSVDGRFLNDETARRAFEKWQLDGAPLGRELDYWVQAETELSEILQTCIQGTNLARHEFTNEFLAQILDDAPAVISVGDAAGKYLFVNRMFETVNGTSRELVLGHTEADLISLRAARASFSDSEVGSDPESTPRNGEFISGMNTLPVHPTVNFTVSIVGDPSSVTCDVSAIGTDQKEFERRLALLHTISRLLAGSVSFEELAQSVLVTIGSTYEWDAGAIWYAKSNAQPLQCLATWCVPDEELQEFCRISSELKFTLGVGLPGKVWMERQPVWISEFETEPNLVRRSLMLTCGLKTAFGCPIQVQERVVGAIELFSRSNWVSAAGFQETIVSVGSQIGQFAVRSTAERSLLLRKHELALAKRIQQGWQPRELVKVSGYEIAGASLPAHDVGGDYFDAFPVPGRRVAIVIGDAAGHGFDSALNIAEVRAYVRALAATESSLQRIFELVNRHFLEHADEGAFVTLLLVRLDPDTGELMYNNAGHLSGFIFDTSGTVRKTMPSTGFPLGTVSGVPYPQGPSQRLNPGEWALLFTDGIIDACGEDGERLGIDRFLDMASELCPGQCARDAVTTLVERVADLANHEFDDDMTAVLIARHAV